MDRARFNSLIHQLYQTVHELEAMFPGRHFTPDGHMVGSIGECLVAAFYDLELMPASNQGFDAKTADGKKVEIKATQANSVAFRSCPEHSIVIKIFPDGSFEECYNGPGDIIWQQFEGKKRPSNGQYQITLTKVKKLNAQVDSDQKIQLSRAINE